MMSKKLDKLLISDKVLEISFIYQNLKLVLLQCLRWILFQGLIHISQTILCHGRKNLQRILKMRLWAQLDVCNITKLKKKQLNNKIQVKQIVGRALQHGPKHTVAKQMLCTGVMNKVHFIWVLTVEWYIDINVLKTNYWFKWKSSPILLFITYKWE